LKVYTALKTLKYYLQLLTVFYIVLVLYNLVTRSSSVAVMSGIFLIVTIISSLFLVNTYKLRIDQSEMIFYKIFGENIKVIYSHIDCISFSLPNKESEKVLIINKNNNKAKYRIAVFDYEDIYTDLRKICKLNEIEIQ